MIFRILLFSVLIFLHLPIVHAFDHGYQMYSMVLSKYVQDGMVDYSALQKDRKAIDDFISELGKASEAEYKSWTRQQQLAFWVNAYNGWFLKIVVDHYPIKRSGLIGLVFPANSVQQINGIWDNIKIVFAGREVSLNHIEHKILRPVFREPRIHFAIVCASRGCPALRSEPFFPDTLNEQLYMAAQVFISNPSKVRLEKNRKKIKISKIFDWFHEDFKSFADEDWRKQYDGKRAGPIAFISGYLTASDSTFLKQNKVAVDYFDYDWSLNDKSR